jgi:hypothetical protein
VKIVSHCFLSHAIIGSSVQLSTGIITSNYDGFMKHPVSIGALAFIGSGAQLVAPVRVGKGAYVASGSIITENVPNNSLAIARSKQINKASWASSRRTRVPAPEQDETRSKRSRYYRRRLEEFTALVSADCSEDEYQEFLQKDYWILGSNYEECLPKPRAGAGHVPDFVLERTDGLFEVVEIKAPGLPLFVRSGKRFVESAELKRAVAQLFEYVDYYKTHYLSESKIQSRDFKVAGGRLVIGRTTTQEEKSCLRQINERYLGILVCTYDDLVAAAGALVKLVEKDNSI